MNRPVLRRKADTGRTVYRPRRFTQATGWAHHPDIRDAVADDRGAGKERMEKG
jgi:hypothetical protein